jgi:hypothetical protein
MDDTKFSPSLSLDVNHSETLGRIVIATGCPHSGWDMALPALQQAGLQPNGEDFSNWHDDFFDTPDTINPITLQHSLEPDGTMADRASQTIALPSSKNILLADTRCLWLLDFWAEKLPYAKFLLFYTAPESSIARMLVNDESNTNPVDIWAACNNHMINFQLRHRDRATFLNAEATARRPALLIQACQRMGVTLDAAVDSIAPITPPPLERAFARMLIESAALSVRHFAMALAAVIEPLSDQIKCTQVTSNKLLEIYRQYKANNQQYGRDLEQIQQYAQAPDTNNKQIEQENELLMIQLLQIQEELEQYIKTNNDLNRTISDNEQKLSTLNLRLVKYDRSLFHKITSLFSLVVQTTARQLQTMKHLRLIKSCDLFDGRWYLAEYSDVARAGMDPAKHYLEYGAKEGRNPSPSFITEFYLKAYPDVADSGMNPLIHFIKYGRAEGRSTMGT